MAIKLIYIIIVLFINSTCYSSSYTSWKINFSKTLNRKGINKKTRSLFLSHAKYNEKVINIYFKQRKPLPITLQDFLDKWLNKDANKNSWVISEGRRLLKKHSSLLDKIEKRYKVDKNIIIALWGIETKYGNYMGEYPVLDSLSTLAYKSKRKKFYKKELISALKIIQRNKIPPQDFLGSWAGAIGHCQFMPTNYFVYGVDYDKDKKKDLFHSYPDIFASIANYLKKNRWKYNKPIGYHVTLPKDFNMKYLNKTYKLNSSWNKLGVRKVNMASLPNLNYSTRIIPLTMKDINYIAAHYNFKVIMRWNRSPLFGLKAIILTEQFKRIL